MGSHNKTKFVGTSLDILFNMSKDGPKSSKDVVKRSVKGKPTSPVAFLTKMRELGESRSLNRLVFSLIGSSCVSSETHNLQRIFSVTGLGGGGVVSYISYIGMCQAKGYGFLSILSSGLK